MVHWEKINREITRPAQRLRKEGRIREAVELLRKGYEKYNDGLIALELAKTLEISGRFEEAKNYYIIAEEKLPYKAFKDKARIGIEQVKRRNAIETSFRIQDGSDFSDSDTHNLKHLLERLKEGIGSHETVFYREEPATTPQLGIHISELTLPNGVKKELKRRGIKQLFSFQEEAIRLILQKRNTLIVAPTGAGKTEAFIIPILIDLQWRKNIGVRAVLIYPTKALARDQLNKMKPIIESCDLTIGILDRDVPQEEKDLIYSDPPDFLITNADMIHYHLPDRRGSPLQLLLANVKYAVLDEVHTYAGVFGAHVFFVLQRLARCVKSDITFIGASATISNAREFAEALFFVSVQVVRAGHLRRQTQHQFVLIPRRRAEGYLNHLRKTRELMKLSLNYGLKAIVFENDHKSAELLFGLMQYHNMNVKLHRGGLSSRYRQRVEQQLREGEIDGVVATPTLQLGIDIGGIDCAITAPIGVVATIQRLGRAGRRDKDSLAIIHLKQDDPVSAYYRKHPEACFSDIEAIHLEPQNPDVAKVQLLSAAWDKPLEAGEFNNFDKSLHDLVDEGLLLERGENLVPTEGGKSYVERAGGIRSGMEIVGIYCKKSRIGEREQPMANRELFPGAIYRHAGNIYRSQKLALVEGVWHAEVAHTKPERKSTIPEFSYGVSLVETMDTREIGSQEVILGTVFVDEIVDRYLVLDHNTERITDSYDTFSRFTYRTSGIMVKTPILSVYSAEKQDQALHAAQHLLRSASSRFVGGVIRELGGTETKRSIILFDASPGGNGLSRLLFDRLEEVVERAWTMVQECGCQRDDGCPNCCHIHYCGRRNGNLSKGGAIEILEALRLKKS